MKNISRRMLIGALSLLLLTTACNLPSASATPVGTILPNATEQVPPEALTSPTVPPIPVTGSDVVSLQCQFCMNDETHAVLIMPEAATFLVSQPIIGLNCVTAKVVNGQRIVICRGENQPGFVVNVCVNNENCHQFPVTLQTCPLDPQAASGALQPTAAPLLPTAPSAATAAPLIPTLPPAATIAPPTVVPPTNTLAAPTVPAVTPTVGPTQAGTSPRLQPTRVSRAGSPQPTTTSLQDPAGFIRWYFGAVWQQRNYQDLWNNYLTPSFKGHSGSGIFEDYAGWWDTVERVDINSVDVMRTEGTYAWVRVNVTFHMKDGRVVANQEYDYDLLYDASRGTWMFDYRTP